MAKRLSCRKISKSDAVRMLARDQGLSEKSATRRFDKAVDAYVDTLALKPTRHGFRFLDIKRPEEGYRICIDKRKERSGDGRSNDSSLSEIVASKPALTLLGAVGGFVLGKVL